MAGKSKKGHGRTAEYTRTTTETDIQVALNLDGKGSYFLDTGVPFLDHMLALWSKHGLFDLDITAQGDTGIDDHHTVEDIGICLGRAFAEALGDKVGIRRYGTALVPMDEALAMAVVDLSGRGFLVFDAQLPCQKVGDFDTELVEEFLRAFAVNAELTLHVKQMAGKNTHHIIEAIFKALGRALNEASAIDENISGVLSTKGSL
ncbi:imidazoleglycerol-phosphate dehydratase [Thermincola ferriacetica]|uniref:Imidazoleglycerol-phosphate dehydratase n=2 Tax=Thermincola TaxID=278993 RepID=D5XD57_THEPJ|nr:MULTISPECIES: imidazoleglycerol-phosphate dehydratase HisB [Thermincola]ADG81705.1 Imidazoleglycerol-phosphate dehydratase [Thermincola potens JR]KNZ69071.1 imidazoleglycerol-phosphate dehydratase [Thermincola ferriacetica]